MKILSQQHDYLKYYDLEKYIFEEVRPLFQKEGLISASDFFCIIIWKANRAKTKIAERLANKGGNLENAVKQISSEIHAAGTHKNRLRILMQEWGFRLPMASAILTVLYPERFTVYDIRVCNSLGKHHALGNIDNKKFERIWEGYQAFLADVQGYEASCSLSLRDKDRLLWGRSFIEQLKDDVSNNFKRLGS